MSNLLEQFIGEYACEKKRMFGCPAYFVNNNMFCGVFADTIFVRLTPGDKENYLPNLKRPLHSNR